MDYKNKYLKYKEKYLILKNQQIGGISPDYLYYFFISSIIAIFIDKKFHDMIKIKKDEIIKLLNKYNIDLEKIKNFNLHKLPEIIKEKLITANLDSKNLESILNIIYNEVNKHRINNFNINKEISDQFISFNIKIPNKKV